MMAIKNFRSNISTNFKELKSDGVDFLNFLKNNKFTVIINWFFILMAYGIKLFFHSISIDTEVIINNYQGQLNAWLSIGRFGLILTKKFFRLIPFNPYVACFLMLNTMFLFSIFLSFLFDFLSLKKEQKNKFIFILPCVFITSPLFTEQFNFILQGFEVSFAIFLVSLTAFFITKWVLNSGNFLYLIFGIFFMIWGFASYQAVVFLYISIILSCFYFIYASNKDKEDNKFFINFALKYAFTFLIGYVFYFIFNKIITSSMGISGVYLDNMIDWENNGFFYCLKTIILYVLDCKMYIILSMPLLYFGFMNLFKNNKCKILFFLSSIALVLSPFFLCFILGHGLIARSQFSLQFVMAFAMYFLLYNLKKIKKLKFFIVLFAVFLSFNQAYSVANYMYTDYMKYQSEVALANKISYKIDSLQSDYGKDIPVVFVGSTHPLNTPNESKGEVIGSSFFEWDKECEFGSNYRILGFMKTIGYPYKEPNQEQINKGKEIAKTMPSWPNQNSVVFKDDLIVVKLSD